ncbi:MAG: 3-isopropylmalate dehydratase large subunit [Candidatus Delongbacteria bacterium]|nr:3-isopropylmalate dehydratase large subunit [Candidatus Delongbacteria bacterium]
MGKTMIEKIFMNNSESHDVKPNDIIWINITNRAARDFGGANVVKNLNENYEGDYISNAPGNTMFTFDVNPTGSDPKYAQNQQICRNFAKHNNVDLYDITEGIGSHLMIYRKFAYPGSISINTDSHFNILGAIGAFGQGTGDIDTAFSFKTGKNWWKVPESSKVTVTGKLPEGTYAKDLTLFLVRELKKRNVLQKSIEFYGETIENLTLAERITLSSMVTEMGGIIGLIPPTNEVLDFYKDVDYTPVYADPDAGYSQEFNFDVSDLKPQISKPGAPHDVVDVESLKGLKVDSCFIGSCTNGTYEDLKIVADILKDKKVAKGIILKIVPATRDDYEKCLKNGLLEIFFNAGALVSNPGCAGCASGQVGMNGEGEITISTGNRNFPGKQGKGKVYLASPVTSALAAIKGEL